MNAILKVLLEVTVYSSVIAGILLLLRALFKKKISAKLQYAAWLLLIVRLMVPITVESGVHFFTIKEEPAVVETAAQETQAESKPVAEAPAQIAPQIAPSLSQNTAPQAKPQTNIVSIETAKKPEIHITWQQAVFGLWIMGMIALGVFFIRARVRFMRRMKETMQMPTEEMQREYDRICEEMMLLSAPELWVCGVASPALMGRRILLPEGLSGQALRYALYHELTHYSRKDHIMVVIMSALRCVYWFNPLVWVSFSAMQTDMEVACDAGVMERIGAEEKRGYLTTLLNMFSAHSVPAIGMAQAESKRAAKARIEGAFRKPRTGRAMRMVSAIAACVILVCCFTTACQPTPEKPIVVNKNDGALENAIEAAPAPEIEVIPAEETDEKEASMIVTEHWTERFERDGLAVNIDADVLTPNVSKYPVYKIEPLEMDEYFIKDFIKKLEDNGFEVENGFLGKGAATKEQMLAMIVGLEKRIADLKEGKCDPDEKDIPIEHLIENAEYSLEDWKAKYNDPEYAKPIDPLPLEYTTEVFKQHGYYSPTYTVKADDGSIYMLDIDTEANLLTIQKESETYRYAGAVSTEDAKKAAEELLEKIGMEEDFVFYSEAEYYEDIAQMIKGEATDFNQLYYVKNYDGIPESMEFTVSGSSVVSADQMNIPIDRENLDFFIDKNGVVAFTWWTPYRITEMENPNVRMKTLDEVKDIFRDQIFYNTAGDDAKKIDIHTIRLGYCVIYVKDEGGFRIVPTWDFIGVELGASGFDVGGSFVAINAIDGSIINRNEGY